MRSQRRNLGLQLILEGKSSSVAPGMCGSATLPKLTPEERKPVDTCARYLLIQCQIPQI
ncbi:hypothetical protein RintRC_6221 [Richelia intracellularis]|nr:hypothetical protein RintRC_6221 [Richelia intracellularis]